MACPAEGPGGPTAYAVRACPFLAELAQREGDAVAASIASDPTRPAARGPRPLLPEGTPGELMRTFRLFHGPDGVVPLSSFEARASGLAGRAGGCPFSRGGPPDATTAPASPPAGPRPAPLAAMGMSFGPGVSVGGRGRGRGGT
jgi:hypothetical protein